MDIVLGPEGLSYRIVGGMVDLWVLAGPTPAAVTEQYTRVVGRPALPPYWSLGFHQCRWGYENVSVLKDVVEGYRAAAIPMEVLISDIDAMDGKRVFTLDPVNYPLSDMRALVQSLHDAGQRWIPIIDPGIKIDPGYTAYTDGLRDDIYLKDITGDPYVGSVWPGPVHFPDFMAPKAVAYWATQIKRFFKLIQFDGCVLLGAYGFFAWVFVYYFVLVTTTYTAVVVFVVVHQYTISKTQAVDRHERARQLLHWGGLPRPSRP